jgi:membrane peptidoglycan carboxypeptidase
MLYVLHGARFSGEASLGLSLDVPLHMVEALNFDATADLSTCVAEELGEGVDIAKLMDPKAIFQVHDHRLKRTFDVGQGTANWTNFSALPSHVWAAAMATEDFGFFGHQGFSPGFIERALRLNLRVRRYAYGGSTITQQLVKNLFLTREKTISRKLQELFITSQVETALGKERIMELYLNIIEFGPHIYGIKQASRHYFGKHPFDLTALESVFLVSLIPSPKRYYHQFTRGEVTDSWRRHLRWIMKTMRDRKKISDYDYVSAAPYSPVFRQRNPPPDDEEEDGNQATDGADAKPQDAPGQEAADGEPDPGTKRQTGPPPGTPAGP